MDANEQKPFITVELMVKPIEQNVDVLALERAIDEDRPFDEIMHLTDVACKERPHLAERFETLKRDHLTNDVYVANSKIPFSNRIKKLIKEGETEVNISDSNTSEGTQIHSEKSNVVNLSYSGEGIKMGTNQSPLLFGEKHNDTLEDGFIVTRVPYPDDLLVTREPVEYVD